MTAKKGQKIHRKSGLIYFYFMLSTGITAIPIAMYKENVFLIMIAIFSLYLVTTGYRMTKRKKNNHNWFDITLSVAMFIASVVMIGKGSVILLVFGIVGLINSILDLKRIFFPPEKPLRFAWLYGHIGKMTGSYIATVTAFVVNNITTGYPLLLWFGPTFIGTFFIAYWISFYRKKENKKLEIV